MSIGVMTWCIACWPLVTVGAPCEPVNVDRGKILEQLVPNEERCDAEAKAVWQVVVYDSDRNPTCIATAFAVSDTMLATNAHVAIAIAEALYAEGKAEVIQHDSGARREVGWVWQHPGYTSAGSPGADVGLIEVFGETLPVALPLAPSGWLRAMNVSDEIRTYGFPGDIATLLDDAHEPWGLDRPRATAGFGRITGLRPLHTDQDADPDTTLLVQHDIRSVSGVSGSPILNAEGFVIAINALGSRNADQRAGLAIRADVLAPLIEMARSRVLPPIVVTVEEAKTTADHEFVTELVSLLEEGDGWIVTWPAGFVVGVALFGLVVLQVARYGRKHQRRLCESLDRFVEAVGQKTKTDD